MFWGCNSLTSVTLSDGLSSIGKWTFWNCDNLTSITIPASVVTIDNEAFSNCTNLGKIVFEGDAPSFGVCAFENVTATAYYPAGNVTWTADMLQNYGGELLWIDTNGNATNYKLSGANVLLGSSLAMNFFIDKDYLYGTEYYAQIIHYAQDDTYIYNIPYEMWDNRSNYLVVTLENLSAKQMADQIEVRVYHADGSYASKTWYDSIRDYAMRVLDDQNENTKTLLVDMLNYGAAAQTYFEYSEYDLANSWLSDEQQAYASQSVTCTDQRVKGENYFGSTLVLKNRIQLTMYFQNISTDMYAVVSYTDHYGNASEYTVSGADFAQYNANIYGVTVDTLAVADGDQPVTVTVYDVDGNPVANAADTVNGYLSRMMSGDVLFEAIAKFTNSAYDYFHQN